MPNDRPPGLSSITEVRGFFEVFLPGLFLLLHITLLICCAAPAAREAVNKWLQTQGNLWAAALAVGLPAGYLLGLVLRLGRTGPADERSGPRCWRGPGKKLISAAEDWWGTGSQDIDGEPFRLDDKGPRQEGFPYPALMMQRVAAHLGPEALSFYTSIWIQQSDRPFVKTDLFRFNFLKNLVALVDISAAKEILAEEMRTRHAAHTCYALFFSALALWGSALFVFIRGPVRLEGGILLTCLAIGELLVLFRSLLPNLRLLRIGEVEKVFTCCFGNRVMLRRLISHGGRFNG